MIGAQVTRSEGSGRSRESPREPSAAHPSSAPGHSALPPDPIPADEPAAAPIDVAGREGARESPGSTGSGHQPFPAVIPEPAAGDAPAAGSDPAPREQPSADPGGWPGWRQSPPGRYVLDWEQAHLDEAVADVFGYHALQCGEPALDALRANRMPHRFRALLPADALPADHPAVRVEHFEELPFETQSLDLVVLPHVLEFAQDPHQVLREVDRVLRPEGRLIVTGFNPVSLWGARQLALRGPFRSFLPREGHFIAVPRLRDWCKLLSFEPERARYGCWRPPCRTQLWLDRTRFLERAGDRWWPICGAVYLLGAVKRVRAMRLIGKAWRRPKAKASLALPTTQRSALPPDRSPR